MNDLLKGWSSACLDTAACVVLGSASFFAVEGLNTRKASAQSALPRSEWAECLGSISSGGPCSIGPGGGLSAGPGGGLSIGPGGGLSIGPGGGLSIGPGGGMSIGPGGGLSIGPGGGMSVGPGGGLSLAPGYKGPHTPCLTGVLGQEWRDRHCPGVRGM